MFLARRLQKDVDEKRTAGELLDQQIARDFARRYLLAACDVFDQFRGFGGVELFQTQGVEQFEVKLCIMRSFQDLATQPRQNE